MMKIRINIYNFLEEKKNLEIEIFLFFKWLLYNNDKFRTCIVFRVNQKF